MSEHFADRLLAAIEEKGSPVCVGIDPVVERFPDEIRDGVAAVDSVRRFCFSVLEAVCDVVPAVKPQSAYFEALGWDGVKVYFDVVRKARELGLLVIGDVKRNDIGSTASAYAAAHLSGDGKPDAITINGYLGADGLRPFIDIAAEQGRGVFILVRTSNPSAASVQDFSDSDGKKFYQHIAEQVAEIGSTAGLVGRRGYSCVGAVVGATWPGEAKELRTIMPQQIFLVPGYGAQGASAADCAASFKSDGTGAIVNSARSVIYAYNNEKYSSLSWTGAITAAAKELAADISDGI